MGRGTSLNKGAKTIEEFVVTSGVWNKLSKPLRTDLKKNKVFPDTVRDVPTMQVVNGLRDNYNLPELAERVQTEIEGIMAERAASNATRGERIKAARAEGRKNALSFGDKVTAPLAPPKAKKASESNTTDGADQAAVVPEVPEVQLGSSTPATGKRARQAS